MKQYTREELKSIKSRAFELTTHYSDSMEQYKRDHAGSVLNAKIDTLMSMDSILTGTDGDYESAWKALHDSLMFDVDWYLEMCESLQRSEIYG